MYTLFRHKIFNGSRTREAYFSGNGVFCYLSGAFSIFFFLLHLHTLFPSTSPRERVGEVGAPSTVKLLHTFVGKSAPILLGGSCAPPGAKWSLWISIRSRIFRALWSNCPNLDVFICLRIRLRVRFCMKKTIWFGKYVSVFFQMCRFSEFPPTICFLLENEKFRKARTRIIAYAFCKIIGGARSGKSIVVFWFEFLCSFINSCLLLYIWKKFKYISMI